MLLAAALCHVGLAAAEEPREFVDAQGNKVREYRDVVKRQVWETQYTEQQQTVLRPELKTEYQTQVRQYQVPITETLLVPELVGRWNPFVTPRYEYKQVQRTRYELKQETIQIPITRYEMKPSQESVKVAKMVPREQEEEIIRRVVVRDLPAAATANTQLAKLPPTSVPANNMATIPIRPNVSTPPAALPAATNPAPAVAKRDPFAPPASTVNPQPAPNSFQPNNSTSMAQRTTIPPPATAPSAMLPPRPIPTATAPNNGAPNGYSIPTNPPGQIPTNAAPSAPMYNMPAGTPNTNSPPTNAPGRYQ
jgi:hypothetical protein